MRRCQFGGNWFQRLTRGCLAAAGVILFSYQAQAFQLYEGDKITARLDSTVSYGLQWRVEDRDDELIGFGNGGKGYSANYDDGNLNYGKGLVSNAFKLTSELDLSADNFGAFIRGTAFYDFENMNSDRERTELTSDAEDAVGRDAKLLDAYVWGQHTFGTVPVQVRLGDQVVSWGESTFIQNSINAINPIDVSKIRVPGAELKEALVPEGMVWASVSPTENLSVEGLYLYDWEQTKVDEPGTYFGSNDFVGKGGKKVVLGSGAVPDNGDAPVSDTLFAVPRDHTEKGDDQGQFGVNMRYYASWLHDTEFGLYYLRYNSRIPYLSVRAGTQQGLAAAGAIIADPNIPPELKAPLANTAYLETAGYRTVYPDDINLYGLGFSTEVFGWAWQGEVSHRQDMPLQIDDGELLLSVFAPLAPGLGGLGQLDPLAPNERRDGFILKDVSQVQTTFTKLLSPILGANGGVFISEIGWMHVHGMPDKDELRLEVAGTFLAGDAAAAAALGTPQESADSFADADSWGYLMLARLDYNNLIGPVGFSPRIAWSHNVDGNSPVGGPFISGRKAITLGLGANYLANWSADLSYTRYFGAGIQNLINDRDFIGFNVKYRF